MLDACCRRGVRRFAAGGPGRQVGHARAQVKESDVRRGQLLLKCGLAVLAAWVVVTAVAAGSAMAAEAGTGELIASPEPGCSRQSSSIHGAARPD